MTAGWRRLVRSIGDQRAIEHISIKALKACPWRARIGQGGQKALPERIEKLLKVGFQGGGFAHETSLAPLAAETRWNLRGNLRVPDHCFG
jgi:hypothetical protein